MPIQAGPLLSTITGVSVAVGIDVNRNTAHYLNPTLVKYLRDPRIGCILLMESDLLGGDIIAI